MDLQLYCQSFIVCRVRVQVCKPSTTIQIKQRIVSLFPVHEQPDSDNLFLAVVRDGAILGLLVSVL